VLSLEDAVAVPASLLDSFVAAGWLDDESLIRADPASSALKDAQVPNSSPLAVRTKAPKTMLLFMFIGRSARSVVTVCNDCAGSMTYSGFSENSKGGVKLFRRKDP